MNYNNLNISHVIACCHSTRLFTDWWVFIQAKVLFVVYQCKDSIVRSILFNLLANSFWTKHGLFFSYYSLRNKISCLCSPICLKELKILNISKNNISSLAENVFMGCTKLEQFNARMNALGKCESRIHLLGTIPSHKIPQPPAFRVLGEEKRIPHMLVPSVLQWLSIFCAVMSKLIYLWKIQIT